MRLSKAARVLLAADFTSCFTLIFILLRLLFEPVRMTDSPICLMVAMFFFILLVPYSSSFLTTNLACRRVNFATILINMGVKLFNIFIKFTFITFFIHIFVVPIKKGPSRFS